MAAGSGVTPRKIAIIGGGPAGLMAAEIIAASGHHVTIYDSMPSVGRKFLMAGRGGLNLTHSESFDDFISRYGNAAEWLAPIIRQFSPEDLRAWCEKLGQPTFVGTSDRVFPKSLKASPLLRAWLNRLNASGVQFALRHKWLGWDKDELLFAIGTETKRVKADAVFLALGGASWPKLGSDGAWTSILQQQDIAITPLQPANCGFVVPWTDIFRQRFEGQPLKSVTVTFDGVTLQGEAMITAAGMEGNVIYALSSKLRQAITDKGSATLTIDLRPTVSHAELLHKLQDMPRGSQSLSTHLRKAAGLSPLAIGLVQEAAHTQSLPLDNYHTVADLIKALPVTFSAPAAIDRAISTAGGIQRDAIDQHFMLRHKPGTFVAGEMLDWEAPTGGYLLQATLSTAVAAANGLLAWLNGSSKNV